MTFSKFSDSNWASWAKILIITALAYAIESLGKWQSLLYYKRPLRYSYTCY